MFSLLRRLAPKKGPDDRVAVRGLVVAVLEGPRGRRMYKTRNIITNAGDEWYAQSACGEIPTNAFANLVLGSAGSVPAKTDTYDSITPIAGTNKAKSTGYPKTNDDDPDNTGKGVDIVSWKFEYAKADFSAPSITDGVITIASPAAGSPVLCHFKFAEAFAKTADDTLKVFVNHEMSGV